MLIKIKMKLCTILLFFVITLIKCDILPILLWHGMGDTCCLPFSMGLMKKVLQKQLNNTYIRSVKIGKGTWNDFFSGFEMHPNKQIEQICAEVQNDSELLNGFNAIGFSQGGQFLRGLIQRCPGIKPKVLISIGGQHQGIYGAPRCDPDKYIICDKLRIFINSIFDKKIVQKYQTQASYWHDALNETNYRETNTFLADINNENSINEHYIRRLHALDKFVMVKFLKDSIVIPKDSEWFQFYEPNQCHKIAKLENSNVYNNLDLKKMLNEQKIDFLEVKGDHLRFDLRWFESIINKYLK